MTTTNNNANNSNVTINAAAVTASTEDKRMKKYRRQKIATIIAAVCSAITCTALCVQGSHIPAGVMYASIIAGIGCYFAAGIPGLFHFIAKAVRKTLTVVPVFPINIIAFFTGSFLILMAVLFCPIFGTAWSLQETRNELKEAAE